MKLDDVMKLQHFVAILTALHMCIILDCPLSTWTKESPSQIPSLKLPGQREVPQCPEEQLGTGPFGICNFTKFSYKTVESRLYWFLFSVTLLSSAAKPQGTLVVFGGWVLGSSALEHPWVSIGLDWAALGFSPLRRTSLSLLRYRNQIRDQTGS